MGSVALRSALVGLDEGELARLARAADRLFVGVPRLPGGSSPRRRRAGRGLEFFEHAVYGSGDDPRHIDWRTSARARQPLVRRFQDEAFFDFYLCLDRSASMAIDGGVKWKLALRLAMALGYVLLHGGSRVGLLVFSGGVDAVERPVRGREAFGRLLASLAAASPRTEGGASRLESCRPAMRPDACAIVIGDFLAPTFMREGLSALMRAGVRVQAIQVLSSRETEMAGTGLLRLRDVETRMARDLTITDEVGARAAARLSALRGELARFCRAHAVPLTVAMTSQSWREVVLAHLRTLAPFHD
jgi:uncharacterized protein (DUF58 family)